MPISVKDVVRFTPDVLKERDPVPVFLLKTPTLRERIALDAEVQAEGVRYPNNIEYAQALRAAVLDQVIEADQPALFEIIVEFEAVNEESGVTVPPELNDRIEEIARTLRHYHRPLAMILAERTRYVATAFLVRAEMFLLSIENDPDAPPLMRRYGRLTEDCQEEIERHYGNGTLFAIGGRTVEMTNLTADTERKNLPSPPASPPDPETSTVEPTPPTARRGKSSGNGTSAIPG